MKQRRGLTQEEGEREEGRIEDRGSEERSWQRQTGKGGEDEGTQ